MTNNSSQNKKEVKEVKKAYSKPKLVVYGNIKELTLSNKFSTTSDSGHNSMS